ncbi:MAG: ATP-binding cassette domain-containing protein [Acidimicrobiia bacterium]
MTLEQRTPVVELENVSRRYGSTEAVHDFNLAIHSGEVVGLVGDNGAGKSTVVKIISGYVTPTGGTMKVMGQPVYFKSPRQARAAGVETVYQDLAIVNDMALWRNFFLGQEMHRNLAGVRILQVKKMARICAERLGHLGLRSVDSVLQNAGTLSGGERQSLAISRAIYFESRLLLLDEPVAALSVRERRKVFGAIDHAKEQGLGVLYIDHNMEHVLPVADRIAVMDRGTLRRIVQRGELTAGELADVVADSGMPADEATS